ncbi:uncharacterized protein F5891DRAFT_1226386 [Suillus fuscotomentosus]|uniref:PIN domain-containing protein n=1 Tax=Suillus fuscotomentosus TaxID=1912939 RepID=A0AAD4E7F9_9AGAM|nr:uncharacterized protein F5891DRAFT_1226386 [Suillus fuscotomentosus]KAG1900691.1 hypothetical protein F5891DRAFT_1226386 [Suillus fuscotomentosus]
MNLSLMQPLAHPDRYTWTSIWKLERSLSSASRLGNTNRRSVINHTPKQRPSSGNRSAKKSVAEAVPEREHSEAKVQKPRKSSQEVRGDKDADIVVVDASVLVHALHQVKKMVQRWT